MFEGFVYIWVILVYKMLWFVDLGLRLVIWIFWNISYILFWNEEVILKKKKEKKNKIVIFIKKDNYYYFLIILKYRIGCFILCINLLWYIVICVIIEIEYINGGSWIE